ncbi:hypothetical protein MRQ36_29860 [Micromonospora sp. R77]|uniref:hypothetical protein n=1 Tax=Micromonospora sp. R77 TaxID=2925836 RepID=UPI001F622EAE|nr:hypothetical protein [Micromonospora sp. R77]MCI4066537.1 hypothetical protein [Micromonospora sp. R77]
MRRWRRVDPWGFRQAWAGFMLCCGGLVALTAAGAALHKVRTEGVEARMLWQLPLPVAFLALWLTMVARFYLVGLWHNERGLLIRHIHRSRLLLWSEVTGFEVRAARLLGGATVRNAVWVVTRDGPVETPVQRRSRIVGWRKNVGPVLSPADFDLTLARLREARGDAQAGGGVVVR